MELVKCSVHVCLFYRNYDHLVYSFAACQLKPTELIFVVESGVFGCRHFKGAIAKFMKAVISTEPIGKGHVRVSIVRTCNSPLLLSNLDQCHSNLSLTVTRFLRRVSFCCRKIQLGAALRTVRKTVLPTAREDANKLVVILSQGKAHVSDADAASEEAKKLTSSGVTIRAIGLKPSSKKSDLLKSLVSNPNYENYAKAGSASHLLYFVDFVQSQMCPPVVD